MCNLVLLLILLLVYGNVIELKRIVSYWGCFRIGLLRNIKHCLCLIVVNIYLIISH